MLREFLKVIVLLVVTFNAQSKLYQVVSQFRHGARYHINNYYDGKSTLQLHGQLTGVGMKQHQTLGSMLRRDYIDKLGFLSDQYVEGEIYVVTTDYNRTFESARSQLYGLYPLGKGEKMPEVDRSYHLPPYSNTSDSSEQMFSLPEGHRTIPIFENDQIDMTNCQNYDAEVQKNVNYQLQTYKQMNLTYYPFLKKMGGVFNITPSQMNFSKISSLYDTLTVDKYLGRPMPKENFTEDDYLNMRHLHYWYNFFKVSFNLSKAINTGKIVKIITDFDDRIKNVKNKTLKWTFISAHDTEATTLMSDLNISSAQCIQELYRRGETTALNCSPEQEYATSLIFELHSDDDKQFYVKIRHDGEYMYLCERKQYVCPYEEWKNRVKSILVDVDAICFGPQYKKKIFLSQPA